MLLLGRKLSGWWRAFVACRLCRRLTLALFSSVLFIEFIILVPSYLNYEGELKQQRVTVALQVLRFYVSGYSGLVQHADILQEFEAAGLLSIKRTGSSPDNTEIGSDPISTLIYSMEDHWNQSDSQAMVVTWTAAQTGLPYAVNARISSKGVSSTMVGYVLRITGLSLFIAFFVTCCTQVVFHRMVLATLLELRLRMQLAGYSSDNPLQFVKGTQRNDELGDVERSFNTLLQLISDQLKSLSTLNGELNQRVLQRTLELEETNKQLSIEIKERKTYEQELIKRNWYDPLTDLPNRALFEEHLGRSLLQSANQLSTGAIIILGLDNFRLLNVEVGHRNGDQIIKAYASTLCEHFREPATVARLGGDIFALHIPDTSGDQGTINQAVQKIQTLDEQGVAIAGDTHKLLSSIGVALYPIDGNDKVTLLKHAELAMQRAKQMPSGRLCFFSTELEDNFVKHRQMISNLREGIAGQEFFLCFQAQFDASGSRIGYEALIRWRRKDGTLISPAEFIPYAEEAGLIIAIGNIVLDLALHQLSLWQGSGKHFRIAVNLSAQQLMDEGLPTRVNAMIKRYGVNPQYLEFEITETAFMENLEQACHLLCQLRELGIQLAIDDFGTGYSSLSYLKKLPVDRIKIDRAFVEGIPGVLADVTMCKTIIDLAHNLGFKVVAEGVETQTQAQWLIDQGCDEMQGFLFGRPLLAEQIH